jgi:predicted RNA-binding Zn-ribbon protein involved in translation (DUF1610 family)
MKQPVDPDPDEIKYRSQGERYVCEACDVAVVMATPDTVVQPHLCGSCGRETTVEDTTVAWLTIEARNRYRQNWAIVGEEADG